MSALSHLSHSYLDKWNVSKSCTGPHSRIRLHIHLQCLILKTWSSSFLQWVHMINKLKYTIFLFLSIYSCTTTKLVLPIQFHLYLYSAKTQHKLSQSHFGPDIYISTFTELISRKYIADIHGPKRIDPMYLNDSFNFLYWGYHLVSTGTSPQVLNRLPWSVGHISIHSKDIHDTLTFHL